MKVPLFRLFKTEKRRLAVALGSNFMLSGFSYIPQVWALSYLTNNIGLAAVIALTVNTIILVVGAIAVPMFGTLGDRVGRRRLFLCATTFGIVWTVPMFMLIDTHNPIIITLALVICFVFAVGASYASQAAFLAELFPPAIRYSGVAFAREVSGAILGGTAPLLATALFAWSGHWWPIAVFMIFNAVVATIAVYFSKYFRSDADQFNDQEYTHDSTGSLRTVQSRTDRNREKVLG